MSETEDEDRRAGSHWADRTVSGRPGTAAGSHGHRHRQDPGEAHRAPRQSQGTEFVSVVLCCCMLAPKFSHCDPMINVLLCPHEGRVK